MKGRKPGISRFRRAFLVAAAAIGLTTVDAKAVGISLFGPYLLVVELASMLLLAALVAAFHLGRHEANE